MAWFVCVGGTYRGMVAEVLGLSGMAGMAGVTGGVGVGLWCPLTLLGRWYISLEMEITE